MSTSLQDRLGVALGLALTAVTAAWWLASTRLALSQGIDTAGTAALALEAVWLARAMALPLVALRLGALRGWGSAAASCATLVATPWPLLLLAWSASTVPPHEAVIREIILLAASLLLPLLGHALSRILRSAQLAVVTGTAIGTLLAASVWISRTLWSWSPT